MQVVCESRTCRTNTVHATQTHARDLLPSPPVARVHSMATQPAAIQHRFMCVKQDALCMYTHRRARTRTLWPPTHHSVSHALHAWACLGSLLFGTTHITTHRGLSVGKRKTETHLAATLTMLRLAPWIALDALRPAFELGQTRRMHSLLLIKIEWRPCRPMHNAGRKRCDLTFHVSLLIPVSTNDVMIRTR